MLVDIEQSSALVPRYEKLEISFQLTETFENPFDIREVEVWGVCKGPKPANTEVNVPGFYYQDFEVVDSPAGEILSSAGRPHWKIRLCPGELGEYEVTINVRHRQAATYTSALISFSCVAGESSGYIRTNGRSFLRYDNGSTYLPVGHNLAWDDAQQAKTVVKWFEQHIERMGSARENWARVWMTNWAWHGLALEWSPSEYFPGYEGVGRYSLQSAWKLDRVMELLEARSIAVQLVIEPHANLKAGEDSSWAANPYNINVAGGFLHEPAEFFSAPEARRLFKQRLRYIIARWSYSTSIMAWELFNEVQNIDSFEAAPVIEWHDEMAEFLRAEDPCKHMITTSSHVTSMDRVWSLPSIDLVQPHLYGPSTIDSIEDSCRNLRKHGKPILIGEFGTDVCGVIYPEDHLSQVPPKLRARLEDGLHLHNGIWAATFLGATAQLWWWNYIDKQDLYGEFAPLIAFWDGEELGDQLLPAKVTLANAPTRKQLWIYPGPLEFFDQASQTSFVVSDDGTIEGRANIHSYLHGTGQPHLKTDPSFVVNLDGGQLNIHWDQVAPNGATLEVLVDDSVEQTFHLSASKTCQAESIEMPSGQHNVQIRNTGADWVLIKGYEFTNCPHIAIKVLGLANSKRAFLWFTDSGNQLYQASTPAPFEQVSATLLGLESGDYLLQAYGTKPKTQGVLHQVSSTSDNGKLQFTLPSFTQDIAVKLRRR